MRSNLPPKEHFLGQAIPEFPDYVITHHIDSGANGHVFHAHSKAMRNSLAFKVVPIANLVTDEKTQYLEEAWRANVLEHESVVRYLRVVDYEDEASGTPCLIFVCDYVDGPSLKRYLEKSANRNNIDLSFIRRFLDTMLLLLLELEERGYQHGDLHAGNILVVKSRFDIDERYVFRVTDFGVRNFSAPSQRPSDFFSVAQIVNELLSLIDLSQSSGLDRFIFDALRDRFVKRHLIETDPTIDPMFRNPRGLLRELRNLDTAYEEAHAEARVERSLNTPFDYPNCEQIGDSDLLLEALYSDRLLELDKIKAHSNVVLTGPRGCGKTTVFRALSLRYLISTQKDQPEDVDYIGVYYRCDDLYFAFPRYTAVSEAATDIPMHYLVVTLLLLLLRDLERWSLRHVGAEWRRGIDGLVKALWAIFGWLPPDGPNSSDLATLTRKLEAERHRAEATFRFARRPGQPLEGFFGPGIMVRACRALRSRFSFLDNRVFHFYIDDYSSPKISSDLQVNLNRLLMHRSADLFFKVSTESPVSFERADIDGKKFVEAREFDFLNLGVRYITGDWEQTAAFIQDLFSRRFRAVANYPVSTLVELLGSCQRNDNARARVARKEAKGSEVATYRWLYGEEVISLMCSGDIHHMIRLVARMVDDVGGREGLSSSDGVPISPASQHRSIRKEAGAVMESIRTVPEVGSQLADVVAVFGKVAQSYLLHRTSANKTGSPPHQASKIEPYEALRLSPQADKIRGELLRYSVFIEDPKGKSRRGNVVPRLFLRRSLIPHFSLTFSQRDSIELENGDIELLLTRPHAFERNHRIRDGRGGRSDGTEDLFGEP